MRFVLFFLVIINISNSYSQNEWKNLDKYFNEFQILLKQKNYDQALIKIDSAIQISKNVDDDQNLIKAYLKKCKIYCLKARYDSALVYIRKAKKFSSQPDSGILYSEAYIYLQQGKLMQSAELLNQALVLAEKNNNSDEKAKILRMLSKVYFDLGEIDKAETYLKDVYSLHQKQNNKKELLVDLINLGTYAMQKNSLNKAKEYFNKALLYTNDSTSEYTKTLYNNLAAVSYSLNENSQAYNYLKKAINEAEKTRDTYLLALTYYNLSLSPQLEKYPDSSIFYAQKSLDFAQKLDNPKYHIRALESLVYFDSITGNDKKQIEHLKDIIRLKDSLQKIEKLEISKDIEKKYHELKKDEIIKLQNENLAIAKQKQQYLIILIIITVLLSIILLKYFLTYKKLLAKNKEIHRLEKIKFLEQLKQKERELISIAIDIEQKNNFINYFYKKLNEVSQKTNNSELNRMINDVKLSINIQKDMAFFTKKFSELHPDFTVRLRGKYPDLSKKEINFLSFIKIGLSNKQIAAMQNITVSAIHKMRYRIKKKMKLDKDVSLDDFIHGIL